MNQNFLNKWAPEKIKGGYALDPTVEWWSELEMLRASGTTKDVLRGYEDYPFIADLIQGLLPPEMH